jgi:hypothetical protein
VCLSSGSSFLFKSPGAANPLLGKALASLEYYAIGGYKPHEYGQIRISMKIEKSGVWIKCKR